MQSIEQIGDDYGGTIALAALAVTILMPLVTLRAGTSWRKELRNRAAWPELLNELSMDRALPRYLTATTHINTRMANLFGQRLLSFRVFNQCLTLELVIPACAALLGWLLFNVDAPGGMHVFDPEPSWLRRWGIALPLITATGLMAMVAWHNELITDFLRTRMRRLRECRVRRNAPPVHANESFRQSYIEALKGLLLALSMSVGIGLAYQRTCDQPGQFDNVFVSLGAFLLLLWQFDPWLALGTVLAATATAFALDTILVDNPFTIFLGGIEPAEVLLGAFLFGLMPLLNALADTISVAATRLFLRRIARGNQSGWMIGLELFVDLIIALGTLLGLVVLLCWGLDVWAAHAPGAAVFDWRGYRSQVLADPTAGVLLFGMVVTTLIPTLIHVGAGGAALFGVRRHLVAQARDKLAELQSRLPDDPVIPPDVASGPLRDIEGLLRRGYGFGFIAAAICMVLVMALALGLIVFVLSFWPTLHAFPYT